MLVKFLRDVNVRRGDGSIESEFRAGEVRELRIDSARHWINRLAALEVRADEAKAGETAPDPPTVPQDPEPDRTLGKFATAQDSFRTRELSGSPTPEATGSASPESGPEQPSSSPRRDRRSMRRRSSE